MNNLQINVIITTSFSALHAWPKCPFEAVSFLRTPHRHVFTVELKKSVSHTDREIEIIMLKNAVDSHLSQYKNKDMGRKSCEDLAVELLTFFKAAYVKVLEDGENGAEVVAC